MSAADELVDVIDDEGNTVGVATRREMRAKRLPHRCTYVLVFNQRGALFVHLRTATKDVYPSHWDVAVGGVLAACWRRASRSRTGCCARSPRSWA